MASDQFRGKITVGSTDLVDVISQTVEEAPNVSYEAQSLSAEQKAQARTNLDALGKSENAVSATKAMQDGDGNPIASTYAKLSSPALTGNVTVNGKSVATSDQIPDVSGFIPKVDTNSNWSWNATSSKITLGSSAVDGASLSFASVHDVLPSIQIKSTYLCLGNDNSTPVQLCGATDSEPIKTLYGASDIASSATISKNAPDMSFTSSTANLTVSDGRAEEMWVKTVAGSLSVTLGDSWVWQGGAEPDLANAVAVTFFWFGTGGIAIPQMKA